MMVDLDRTDINLLLNALNDREAVLARDWEIEHTKRPFSAQAEQLRKDLAQVRGLAYRLGERFKYAA